MELIELVATELPQKALRYSRSALPWQVYLLYIANVAVVGSSPITRSGSSVTCLFSEIHRIEQRYAGCRHDNFQAIRFVCSARFKQFRSMQKSGWLGRP